MRILAVNCGSSSLRFQAFRAAGGAVHGLEWCGLVLDEDANRRANGTDERTSSAGAAMEAWVVRNDEESIIAHETVDAPGQRGGSRRAA
jgi:acetate kinase